jgi:hypothetical protein
MAAAASSNNAKLLQHLVTELKHISQISIRNLPAVTGDGSDAFSN